MKAIILFGALVISAGAYAQARPVTTKAEKQTSTPQTEIKQQSEKVQQDTKVIVEQKKEQVSKIERNPVSPVVKKEPQDQKDKATATTQDKKEMVDQKIGQSRAAEAKAKAATVKTKADADAMIRMSKEDTNESVKSIDDKMVSARQTLMDQLASKKITQAQFDAKLKQLMEFEKRKSAIVKEME